MIINMRITIKGRPYESLIEACRHYRINVATVYARIEKKGWDLEKAVTTKNVTKKPVKDHLGNEYESYAAMAKAYGLSPVLVRNRISKYGWTLEEALSVGKLNNTREDKKTKLIKAQENYSDLLTEVDRLKMKLSVLEKTIMNCRGAGKTSTHELVKKVSDAGVSVSNACSYANYLANEVHKF